MANCRAAKPCCLPLDSVFRRYAWIESIPDDLSIYYLKIIICNIIWKQKQRIKYKTMKNTSKSCEHWAKLVKELSQTKFIYSQYNERNTTTNDKSAHHRAWSIMSLEKQQGGRCRRQKCRERWNSCHRGRWNLIVRAVGVCEWWVFLAPDSPGPPSAVTHGRTYGAVHLCHEWRHGSLSPSLSEPSALRPRGCGSTFSENGRVKTAHR